MQIFVNSSGRCPHGSVPGACPMCGGGSGGVATKPKVVVGMSWAEAASEFNRLQKLESNVKENKQLSEAGILQQQIEQFLATMAANARIQPILQFVQANFIRPVATAMREVTMAVADTVKAVAITVRNALQGAVTNLSEMVSSLIGVGGQISAFFGERMEAIRHFVENNLKEMLSKMFQQNILHTLMAAVFNQQEKLAGFVRDAVSKLVDRLMGLFPFLDEEDEDYLFKENKRRFKFMKKFKLL